MPTLEDLQRDLRLKTQYMDGFLSMIEGLVRKNGLPNAEVCGKGRPNLTLPGY